MIASKTTTARSPRSRRSARSTDVSPKSPRPRASGTPSGVSPLPSGSARFFASLIESQGFGRGLEPQAAGLAWSFDGSPASVVQRGLLPGERRALRSSLDPARPGIALPPPGPSRAGGAVARRPSAPAARLILLHARHHSWKAALYIRMGPRAPMPPAAAWAVLRRRWAAWVSSQAAAEQARRAWLSWHQALNLLEEGLLEVDSLGRVRAGGRSAAAILGVTPAELAGRPLDELLGIPGVLEWPPHEPSREVAGTSLGGAPLAVALRSSPLPDGRGWIVALSDLGAERHALEQTRRRDRLAVLGELSAGVAHEIRNPLAGIATSAQVLRNRLGEDLERRRFLDVILEEVNRLDRIVSGLLDYARPWTLSLKRVALPECVSKVLGLVADTAERQGVRIELACPDDLPEIFADRDQLTQVLLNIFRNSLEAMPQGGRLRVQARQIVKAPFVRRSGGRRASDRLLPQPTQPPPRPMVQLEISDTGEGIHPEHLPRLFDPFFTTKATGTGLGLSICQSIVHEHGGSISASSTPGHGTVITLELPLEKRHGQRRKDG